MRVALLALLLACAAARSAAEQNATYLDLILVADLSLSIGACSWSRVRRRGAVLLRDY